MPAKPIKHGIKVYAMYCAVSGIMIAWNVYTGAEEGVVNTTTKICADLAKQANIHNQKGRKSRADSDFFLRLSRGAKDSVKRGWFREAVLEMKTPSGKKYYIQAKQVCFLSTNEVGFSDGMTVKRHTKKRERRDTIDAPRAQQDYSQFFNAVDRNDRDSSDYSTTIRTNRYYLRIFCWALDRIIHALYVIVCELSKRGTTERLGGEWPEYWSLYGDKNGERRRFQVDLGIALMNYGIGLDWDGDKDSQRPSWMRQSDQTYHIILVPQPEIRSKLTSPHLSSQLQLEDQESL
eukprot:scaffold2418_cov58-Cyclotella_meneghiniana.AAC.2